MKFKHYDHEEKELIKNETTSMIAVLPVGLAIGLVVIPVGLAIGLAVVAC